MPIIRADHFLQFCVSIQIVITFAQGIAMLGFFGIFLQAVVEAQAAISPVFRLLDEVRLYAEYHRRNLPFAIDRKKKNITKTLTHAKILRKMLPPTM